MQACWISNVTCATTRRHRVCAKSRCQSTGRDQMAEVAWLPRGPRSEWSRLGSRALIIRLIIRAIRLGPTGSDQIDEAPNVSRPDPSGADQIDAEHQATDLAVGVRIPRGALNAQPRSSKRSFWRQIWL